MACGALRSGCGSVIPAGPVPAKAGSRNPRGNLDSRVRGNDEGGWIGRQHRDCGHDETGSLEHRLQAVDADVSTCPGRPQHGTVGVLRPNNEIPHSLPQKRPTLR